MRMTWRGPIGTASNRWAFVLAFVMAFGFVGDAYANPISKLPGRWSGFGSLVHASGAKEQLRCVATYFLENSGRTLRQNLRCASPGYKIDVVANLKIRSGAVTGDWNERIRSSTGSINGRTTASGLNLSVKGQNFSAAVGLTTGACKQKITIAPQGLNIRKISIGLAKC